MDKLQKEQIAKILILYLFYLKDNKPNLPFYLDHKCMMNISEQLLKKEGGKRYAYLILKSSASQNYGPAQIRLANLYLNKQISIPDDEKDPYHPRNLLTAADKQGYMSIPEKNEENLLAIKKYCKEEWDTCAESAYQFGLLSIDDLKNWYFKNQTYLHTPYVIRMYYLNKGKYQKAKIWLEHTIENGNTNAIYYHSIAELLTLL